MLRGASVGKLKCQTDPYLKKLNSTVLSCTKVTDDKYEVILDDTIIFPTGGGQPHDLGFLETPAGNIEVLGAERRVLECVHFVSRPIEANLKVTVHLDWKRRLDHMQQHSGQRMTD
jgi:misacylated tRNA(Ala) deacylase